MNEKALRGLVEEWRAKAEALDRIVSPGIADDAVVLRVLADQLAAVLAGGEREPVHERRDQYGSLWRLIEHTSLCNWGHSRSPYCNCTLWFERMVKLTTEEGLARERALVEAGRALVERLDYLAAAVGECSEAEEIRCWGEVAGKAEAFEQALAAYPSEKEGEKV